MHKKWFSKTISVSKHSSYSQGSTNQLSRSALFSGNGQIHIEWTILQCYAKQKLWITLNQPTDMRQSIQSPTHISPTIIPSRTNLHSEPSEIFEYLIDFAKRQRKQKKRIYARHIIMHRNQIALLLWKIYMRLCAQYN